VSTAVVRASVRAVPRRAVGLLVAAAGVLLAATWPALEHDSAALLVLRGVAVLLATALALAVDETPAPLLEATPTPLAHRVGARVALCAAVLLPAWAAAVGAAVLAGADVPVAMVSLELAALAAVGLGVPMSLRRWWRVSEPAVVTGPVLLGTLLAAAHLPRQLALLPASPLDPAWDPAHQRWAVVLGLASALVVVTLADPATATTRRRPLRG